MLIETVADRDFAEAVKIIAEDIRQKNGAQQHVKRSYKLELEDDLTKIISKGGHIDQVIPVDGYTNLIIYSA